jgi:hypothetical protein
VLLAVRVRDVSRLDAVVRAAELALQAVVLIPEQMLVLGQIAILELERGKAVRALYLLQMRVVLAAARAAADVPVARVDTERSE